MSVFWLRLRRMPGVSIATKLLPSSSKRTSTLSRVVPGTSLTIIRSAWTSVLTNVLLPTLRRPTMATFISGSPISSGFSVERRRKMRHDHVQQHRPIAILDGADAERLAAAEPVELVGLAVERFGIGLVGQQDDRALHGAEPLGDVLVERQHPLAGVDDEQDHGGRIDRQGDLVLDVLGEVVHVGEAHAAGVDQLEEPVVVAHQVGEPIAGDAGLVVDDGDADAREPIEHAAFADVGPTDDDDLGNAH